MKSIRYILIAVCIVFIFMAITLRRMPAEKPSPVFIKSVDTMKFSRDIAYEKLHDSSYDIEIDRQVASIASLGATHIAIATPYDEVFLPYLKRWVTSARKHGLHVWFRGNFSGWEGWFQFAPIGREEHRQKNRSFILNNPELFADGDIYTSCPECENGGPGDPRWHDLPGFRQFIIAEYRDSLSAFEAINKKVTANFYSMNGDVAELVMDRNTTAALSGIVTLDHYVASPRQLMTDVKRIAEKSGGKVVLGEVGVPIPDIHGEMTEKQQAEWLAELLSYVGDGDTIIGINYWTNEGSSTSLWGTDGTKKHAAEILRQFYTR